MKKPRDVASPEFVKPAGFALGAGLRPTDADRQDREREADYYEFT